MEQPDWLGLLLLFVGMAVAGAGVLLGRDWIEKRGRRGAPLIPGGMLTLGLVLAGLLIFLWFLMSLVALFSTLDF